MRPPAAQIGRAAAAIALFLAAAGAAAGPAVGAGAWSPETHLAVAREAARIAPPDLARQLERHRDAYRRGVLAPFGDGDPARHEKSPEGGGRLDRVVRAEADEAVRAIRAHRGFAEVVYRLGVVAHYVADASDPLAASGADPREAVYRDDYRGYLDSARPRFAVVFYGDGRDLDGPDGVSRLVERSLGRGRGLYPSIGAEYRRIGAIRGRELFDDRSTAFGVGALAFSHAVSDVAAMLRYVWLAAGGADPRPLPLTPAAGSPPPARGR